MTEDAPRPWVKALGHPAVALGLGLAFFPLARLFFVPAYVMNFLLTLVHEVGHSIFAWLMGCVSIPTVGIFGGGVAPWYGPYLPLQVAVGGGVAWAAWTNRDRLWISIPAGILAVALPAMSLSGHHETVIDAGGVAFELIGAAACFAVVVGADLERPFERPLYALWGWWMLLSRGTETLLMLSSQAYWEEQRIYESGLAAGLVNDLHKMQESWGMAPRTLLGLVFAGCLLALPVGALAGWGWRRNAAKLGTDLK